MKNFNWEEFKNGNVVVVCKTKELAKDFLNKCKDEDMIWCDKSEIKDSDIWYFEDYITYSVDGTGLYWGASTKRDKVVIDWCLEEDIEKIKPQKTFRELMKDGINKDEIWENKDSRVKRIYINDYGNLTFEGEDYTFSMNYSTCIGLDDVYELKIIGCPFEKAFREYEQGKVIGSNYGYRYKKIGDRDYVYDKDLGQWIENEESFAINEIREEWFVEG